MAAGTQQRLDYRLGGGFGMEPLCAVQAKFLAMVCPGGDVAEPECHRHNVLARLNWIEGESHSRIIVVRTAEATRSPGLINVGSAARKVMG